MKRILPPLAVVLALAGAGSCDSVGPVAGVLTVSLRTPNPGADGAILFTVTGPATPVSVTPEPGLRVFSQATLSSTNRFSVTGPLANGALLTIGVPDVRQASQYVATVAAVAANDFSLRLLSAYSLSVSR